MESQRVAGLGKNIARNAARAGRGSAARRGRVRQSRLQLHQPLDSILKARVDVTGPIGPDIQSAMDGLLSEAVGLLLSKKGDINKAVHDARKNLKAFRSYLRLLRAIIGDDYVTLNVQARDAARTLAQARDSVALHDAIDLVEKFYGHRKKQRPAFEGLRQAADAEGRDTASDQAVRAASKEVAALLAPCREMVASWSLPENPAPYIKGLRTTYKAARSTLGRGLDTRLPYELHEARKRVIHWRYQLDLFTGLWPRVLKATVRELQALREDLGQHNDLVLLETRIHAAERGFAGLSDVDAFLDAITVLRARRVQSARYREKLLFSDTPDMVASRLSVWWAAAGTRKFIH